MDYLLNLRNGMLHTSPSREECNVDAIPRRQRRKITDKSLTREENLLVYRYRSIAVAVFPCEHCKPVLPE